MNDAVAARFARFCAATEPVRELRVFVTAFFAIWALYDILDALFKGTASAFWLSDPRSASIITTLQFALIVVQIAAVVLTINGRLGSVFCRALIAAAALLRAVESFGFFGLNDFYYYCITAFILVQFHVEGLRATVWPRRVLLYQTAWMYLATALLKMNPAWLSGDHLWVRFGYVTGTLHLSGPWAGVLSDMRVDRALALFGSCMEFAMGIALLLRAPRWACLSLAVAIHGFAALTVNVFFFGASMIAQVWFVSRASSRKQNRS